MNRIASLAAAAMAVVATFALANASLAEARSSAFAAATVTGQARQA